jgi:tripartite-type tricarboxylate transporter receptor subunit TctC
MIRHATRTVALTAALAAAGLTLTACSGGDGGDADFPSDDLTLIVQADAGGGSDLTSRALATELEPVLGQSIVVENRPGASGSTAMQYVADQDADGYTIGFVPVEIAMLGHEGFDVDPADYDFLGQIMLAPGVLVVPADSPYDTLEEFVAAAQDAPLSVANSGAGSIWEVAALGLAEDTGAQINPVPFDGGAPAIAAAIGGQVDGAVGGAGEVSAAAAEGQVKPLVVFPDARHPDLPDVPTAAEAGFEDLEFGGWGGIYAPAGLPDDVRSTLESAIAEASTSDGFVDTVTKAGNLVVNKSADEFTAFVDAEYERFGTLLGGE